MKTPWLLNFFSAKTLATAHHAWMVFGLSLSQGDRRLRCSGCGSAAPAHTAGVVSVFFRASVHPCLHLSEHHCCFGEEPTGTLRSLTQTASESPVSSVNAGVIFLLCVADCFTLLHFTQPPLRHHPFPNPAVAPGDHAGWGHRGTRGAEGTQRGRRAEAPPRKVAVSTGSPAEPLAVDAAF